MDSDVAGEYLLDGDEESKEEFEKFAKVKSELKLEMETQHWYPKWKKIASEWIDKITIFVNRDQRVFNYYFRRKFMAEVVIVFPTAPNGCQFSLSVPIIEKEMMEKIGSITSNLDHPTQIDISFFRKYRKLAKLKRIPINLHANIILQLVGAFDNCGGRNFKFDYETSRNACDAFNWMWCDNQHLFPEIIHVTHPSNLVRNANGIWIRKKLENFVSGKLLAVPYYSDLLIESLDKYQSAYVIDNWFYARGKKLLQTAHNFSDSLSCEWHANKFKLLIDIPKSYNFFSYQIVANVEMSTSTSTSTCRATELEEKAIDIFIAAACCKHQKSVNKINCKCLNQSSVTQFIGDLTREDLGKIFKIFIERQRSKKELQEIISSNDIDQQFPSATDHFESFDPLHLRGTLTKSPLSLKLTAHAENINRLRKDAMDSLNPVPTAVVDLMESYLSI